jgi:hypothetical protein
MKSSQTIRFLSGRISKLVWTWLTAQKRSRTYQGFVRFLIDNQLPRALAKLLQNLGHHAVHVLDVELARVNDLAIWIALKIIVLRARSNRLADTFSLTVKILRTRPPRLLTGR